MNAHTHLELSALRGRIPFPQPGFREWIELLFPLRAAMDRTAPMKACAPAAELFDQRNSALRRYNERRSGMKLRTTCYLVSESILPSGRFSSSCWDSISTRFRLPCRLAGWRYGPSTIEARSFAARPPQVGDGLPGPCPPLGLFRFTGNHSGIKEWTRERGLPFSIHAAEHCEEIEFLRSGKGFCRELLDRLGRWDPGWKPPGKTPIEYLDGLGALDSRTLLVHAVHMTESDWALAAQRNCTAVFCPRSNRNLGSGSPRIDKALSLGINCALGTDSLASNTDLNLFAEAAFTLDNHPSIDPEKVIEMITLNPARALGRKGDFGSIEPGAGAHILAVTIPSGVDESNLAEALIQSGKEGAWKWVDDSQS